MKISVWVLSALLLAALYLLESGSHGQDNFVRVARIFGRDIYMSDLEPTDQELEFIKRGTENMRRQMEKSPSPAVPHTTSDG
jgi:hypothetical protein